MPKHRDTDPEKWAVSKGVSLAPSMWREVDDLAESQGKFRSEVIREAVALFLSVVHNSDKIVANNGKTAEPPAGPASGREIQLAKR